MAKPKAVQLKLDGPGEDFVCKFLDGPWADHTVTYKRDVQKFEVGRPRVAGDDGDRLFRYQAVATRNINGLKETDYKMTYDGPAFIGGKHA